MQVRAFKRYIPLRYTATFLHDILIYFQEGAWHCFSFEPEGRTSDVSIISGRHLPTQTRSVINLELPGCSNSPFNYQEVKVWCRPPDKNCDRGMWS